MSSVSDVRGLNPNGDPRQNNRDSRDRSTPYELRERPKHTFEIAGNTLRTTLEPSITTGTGRDER